MRKQKIQRRIDFAVRDALDSIKACDRILDRGDGTLLDLNALRNAAVQAQQAARELNTAAGLAESLLMGD